MRLVITAPNKMKTPKNTNVNFGKWNTVKKIAMKPNCRAAAIQILPPPRTGRVVVQAGHVLADESAISKPHLGHCRVDAIAPDYSSSSGQAQLTEVMSPSGARLPRTSCRGPHQHRRFAQSYRPTPCAACCAQFRSGPFD